VKVFRAALVAAVVVNLALLAASAPLRATLLRYDVARKRQELRALALENRTLVHQAALARRPDRVAARAAEFGIELRAAEPDVIVRGEAPLNPPRPAARPPRPAR
jgi:hypothetical protein